MTSQSKVPPPSFLLSDNPMMMTRRTFDTSPVRRAFRTAPTTGQFDLDGTTPQQTTRPATHQGSRRPSQSRAFQPVASSFGKKFTPVVRNPMRDTSARVKAHQRSLSASHTRPGARLPQIVEADQKKEKHLSTDELDMNQSFDLQLRQIHKANFGDTNFSIEETRRPSLSLSARGDGSFSAASTGAQLSGRREAQTKRSKRGGAWVSDGEGDQPTESPEVSSSPPPPPPEPLESPTAATDQQHQQQQPLESPKSSSDATDPQYLRAPHMQPIRLEYDIEKGAIVHPSVKRRPSTAASSLGISKANKQLSVKDYQLLAFACQRAGKPRQEANAYFHLGQMFEKSGSPLQSIEYYKKYLTVVHQLGDAVAVCVALNCIGVLLQLQSAEESRRAAIEYHSKQGMIDETEHGKYVACMNSGIAFLSLHNMEEAVEQFKLALQHAIRDQNRGAESTVLACLGSIPLDPATAKACTERHLELSRTLKDDRGKMNAFQQLGKIIQTSEGDLPRASECFEQAMKLARKSRDSETFNSMKVNLGVLKGKEKVDKHMKQLGDRLRTFQIDEEASP